MCLNADEYHYHLGQTAKLARILHEPRCEWESLSSRLRLGAEPMWVSTHVGIESVPIISTVPVWVLAFHYVKLNTTMRNEGVKLYCDAPIWVLSKGPAVAPCQTPSLWILPQNRLPKIFFVKFLYKSITSTNSFTPAGFLFLIENHYHLEWIKSMTYRTGPRVTRVASPFYSFLKKN